MKRKLKGTLAVIASLAVIVYLAIPLLNVSAGESYGEGDNILVIGINNELDFTIDGVFVNGHPWSSDQDEYRTTDGQYHIEINVSGNQTTGDKVPRIQYGGNWNEAIQLSSQHNNNSHTFVLDVDNSGNQGFLGLEILEDNNNPGPEPGNEPGEEPNFDGKAYVVWSCDAGACYHYFDNIPDFNDGNSTFYKDTEITADNDNTKTFDIDAQYKGWYTKEGFESWVEDYELATGNPVNWATLDASIIAGEPEQNVGQYEEGAIASGCEKPNFDAHWSEWNTFESCVNHYAATQGKIWTRKLQPVGEPQVKNAYVSYGDRNFKVVIYNSKYKGITMGNLSELNYYPSSWANPFIMRDQFDISDSTKSKPASINSILLEDTVLIKPLPYNSFGNASIEALDVPSDAVNITEANGVFRLEFSSNFYDKVVFKVTDNNNEVSYLRVDRYTIDGWIGNIDNHPTFIADIYFDRTKSYTDFDLTAKIIYKNGTIKNVALEPHYGIDDGLGNITEAYEVDEENVEFGPGGKGLKRATFVYTLNDGDSDRNIQDVYVNAEYKGSTASSYAGAFAGSGQGVQANIYHGEEG